MKINLSSLLAGKNHSDGDSDSGNLFTVKEENNGEDGETEDLDENGLPRGFVAPPPPVFGGDEITPHINTNTNRNNTNSNSNSNSSNNTHSKNQGSVFVSNSVVDLSEDDHQNDNNNNE